MSLAEIMSSTSYEVGQGVGMKLVMHVAELSATQLSMAIDDLHEDGYRFSRLSAR